MSRPDSVASSTQSMPPPAVPSNVTSFVDNSELLATNLRLLNLDLLDDWPAITSKTFSTKDVQQNQKQRIRCTEWTLFRLFELWDPQEARDKLLPFFPPLEPLQSLNLRAALFRSLNDLKKNGLLGREIVLRKTMLDECKGEKLMEVLVMFSTAVLRKMESRYTNNRKSSVSARLAMADAVDAALLLPLTVAHGASLSRLADRREEQNNRFIQFNNLLDCKYLQLQERLEASESVRRASTADADGNQVHKVLQQNWSGNTAWVTTILCGEDHADTGDSPLELSFNGVWQAVSEGTQLEAPSVEKVGLLENLEARIQRQAERSQNWQAFLYRMIATQRSATQTANQRSISSEKVVHAFKFDQHRQLQMGTPKSPEVEDSAPPLSGLVAQEHEIIMMDAQKDMVAASTSRREGGKGWSTARATNAMSLAPASSYNHDIFSPLKPTDSQPYPARAAVDIPIERPSILTNRPSFPAPFKTSRSMAQIPMSAPSLPAPLQLARTLTRPSVSEDKIRMAPPPTRLPVTEEPTVQPRSLQRRPLESSAQLPEEQAYPSFGERPFQRSSIREAVRAPADEVKIAQGKKQMHDPVERPLRRPARLPSPELSEMSSEEETATEQIIASVFDATPSPLKEAPRLTLTERTRMSMAPIVLLQPDEDDKIDSAISLPEPQPEPADTHLSRRMSLAERTRQSMAAAGTHTHKARKSLDLLKQRRMSQFPVNQFETPGKSRTTVPDARPEATPIDKLFSEEADYDSVFKTRPKVALSPVWSPDTSSLSLNEAMNGEGDEEVWENSPLANRRLATNTTSG